MKISVVGRNIDVTPSLKSYAEEKIGKFDRYMAEITEAHITLSVQKYIHKAEVLMKANGNLIQAEGVTEELYSAIDEVAQKLERQVKKLKDKIKSHRKTETRSAAAAAPADEETAETGRIIRTEPAEAKPISPEDAAAHIDMNNLNFMAFTNDKTGELNVIYKRSDGNYGLIAPAGK